LVGGFITPSSSPFLAVGGTAIDLTPIWLKDFAVRTFGSYDNVVLLLGMAVMIGLIGVTAGLLSRRSRTPGLMLFVVLGIVATVAVLTRPTAGALDVIAPLVALIVSVGTFVVLHRLGLLTELPTGDGAAAGVSRRALLVGSVTVAVGAGIAAAGGQLLTGGGGVESSRTAVGRIMPTVAAPRSQPGRTSPLTGHPLLSPRTGIFTGWTSTSHCRNCVPRTGGYGSTGWSTASSR
jgi:hypothetical protein